MGTLKTPNMLDTLARYSKTNLTLLISDEMQDAVDSIWLLSERSKGLKFYATEVELTQIIVTAQRRDVSGVLVRCVDRFTYEQQAKLAKLVKTLPTSERGKFIFTANEFSQLNSDLLASVCKIQSKFKYENKLAVDNGYEENKLYEN